MDKPLVPTPAASVIDDLAFREAVTLHKAGKLEEAERLYRTILFAEPRHTKANYNLGVLAAQRRQPAIGLPFLKLALDANPNRDQYWVSYVNALIEAGQLDIARKTLAEGRQFGLAADVLCALETRISATDDIAQAIGVDRRNREPDPGEINSLAAMFSRGRYREMETLALRLTVDFPRHGAGWKALAAAVVQQGRRAEAFAYFEKAALLLPLDAEAQSNLGNALHEQGNPLEAEICYRLALRINPNSAEAHNNLGITLKDLGRLAEAEASYRLALDMRPDYAEAFANLGNVLQMQGRLAEAEASYRQALNTRGDAAAMHANLAANLLRQSRLPDAAAEFQQAIERGPDSAELQNSLGICFHEQGMWAEAEACYMRALELMPDHVDAHINLAITLDGQGRHNEADAHCRRALDIRPDDAKIRSIILFNHNYTGGDNPAPRLAAARDFGRMLDRGVRSRFTAWRCRPRPERLRIGFVSGDLQNHPVAYFLEGLLTGLRNTDMDFIAYSTSFVADECTLRLKHQFSEWKSLAGYGDEAAARLIHADAIHILIDLSGHTAGNRLPVFAWKPAPVQVNWLGYFATTGVTEIDYLLADRVGVPEEDRPHFTETIWYLPETRLCFAAPVVNSPVSPLPALVNGYPTFGCFQNLSKVGDDVLFAWGRVLASIPGARLRLQCRQLGFPAARERLRRRMNQQGMDTSRVSMHGRVDRQTYIANHAEVDMILDTFPYPGGTTTCEALWLGVPTVTLAGNTLLARQGASLLTAAGLTEWIAVNADHYVRKAVSFASAPATLAALRSSLRERVLATPLFDAPRFAADFQHALWGMWRQYQNRDTPHGGSASAGNRKSAP